MLSVSRGARLAASFCVLVLIALVAVPAVFDAQISAVRSSVVHVSEQQADLDQVVLALALQVASIRGYSLNGDPTLLDDYREARKQQDQALERLMDAAKAGDSGLGSEIAAFRDAALAWGAFPEDISARRAEAAAAAELSRRMNSRDGTL